MTMTLQHMGIFAFAIACLLIVPSLSDESQVSHEDLNAGEPNGNIRLVNDKNKNEKKKEKKFNKERNKKEKKKEKNFKKQQNQKEKKKEEEYKKINGSSTKMGPCTGTGGDWACCSDTNPCQEKQGDCDADSHCLGSLVCGKDNCRDFNPQAEKLADCCIGPGTGTEADWNFCKSTSPCQENQGDCDHDSDCAGSLVCGTNNCRSMNPQAQAAADCCIKKPGGTGSSTDWSFCSSSSPCLEKQGDCDSDSECSGSLVCGTNNCQDFHPQANAAADCCIKPAMGTGSSSDWSFCTSSSPCQQNQGDCDSDSECAGSLVCGYNNCRDFHSNAQTLADCCIEASCKCGVKKQGTRIVGGVESQVNEYPWMVLLSMGCGGSVIADRWVLTAAHCFYNSNGVQTITNPSSVTITLGEHDRTISSETLLTKAVNPDKIIIHDSYDPTQSTNDLALLRLPSAIDVSVYTPVCLPNQGEDYTGEKVWVYGWGATSEGGFTSATLQELEITVVDDDVAKDKYSLSDSQLAAMVFAGGEKGKDACQGDSGGPLSYDRNGQHELVGATSWGIGCAREGNPGAYTEVSAFRNWIDQKIGGANTC